MNKKKKDVQCSSRRWVECLIFLKSLLYSATATLIPSFLSHSLLLLLHHPRFGKPEESTLVSPPPTSLAKKHEGRVQAIHGVSFLLHRDIHHVAGRGSSATIGLRLTNDFDRHDHHEHRFYIIEGLSSGFMFVLGGIGIILLDLALDRNRAKSVKVSYASAGVSSVVLAYVMSMLFIRIKIPAYLR
ncbi:hypothetical protein DEO72_LG10g4097 [Vigna unguiculata]|uniref:Uncharacterized protein n=1 Tax=Vigna unguiculata TaxID=3917 RepID=A0A4D6NLU0_VIGUN|nr:hypothetical protein DEO72_LG10g4097 [Vigna unguiculata]